jgi:hypothetical protein
MRVISKAPTTNASGRHCIKKRLIFLLAFRIADRKLAGISERAFVPIKTNTVTETRKYTKDALCRASISMDVFRVLICRRGSRQSFFVSIERHDIRAHILI